MAQLNPTSGKFNKFAINEAGTSSNALVFGKNQNPVDSTYGFDSSSNQTGVSVFFSNKNIAPGKSTTLEIWMWDGSAWSLWATIDGNDAGFSSLLNTSVNIAWSNSGTTYSKMYFNAKNLDTGMKLRVTGQESTIIIDDTPSDGIYDQNYLIGVTAVGSVTEADLNAAVSARISETSSIEKEIKDEKTETSYDAIKLKISDVKILKGKEEVGDARDTYAEANDDQGGVIPQTLLVQSNLMIDVMDDILNAPASIEIDLLSVDLAIKGDYHLSVRNSLQAEISAEASNTQLFDQASFSTHISTEHATLSTAIENQKWEGVFGTMPELIAYIENNKSAFSSSLGRVDAIISQKASLMTRLSILSDDIANS